MSRDVPRALRSQNTLPFEPVAPDEEPLPLSRPSVELAIGRLVAHKYVIEEALGEGSSGNVYRARQLALDMPVAIKLLHRGLSGESDIVERFHREARAASRLDHPNFVRVIDFGQERNGTLYLVMEYIAGRDLHRVLAEEKKLATERIAAIVSQVLAALAVAHDRGIIHRDLKPENILLTAGMTDDGEPVDVVKVCDFGIATLATPEGTPARPITGHGMVVGTPEYMSPEQARGGALDGRSDLYAVGCVLYHLLTGQPPFTGAGALATAIKHISARVIPPSELTPGVDPGLERICLRALEKDPAQRYQDARAMRADLRAVLSARAEQPFSLERVATDRRPATFAELDSAQLQVMATSVNDALPIASPTPRRGRRVVGALLAAALVAAGAVLALPRATSAPTAAAHAEPVDPPRPSASAVTTPSASAVPSATPVASSAVTTSAKPKPTKKPRTVIRP